MDSLLDVSVGAVLVLLVGSLRKRKESRELILYWLCILVVVLGVRVASSELLLAGWLLLPAVLKVFLDYLLLGEPIRSGHLRRFVLPVIALPIAIFLPFGFFVAFGYVLIESVVIVDFAVKRLKRRGAWSGSGNRILWVKAFICLNLLVLLLIGFVSWFPQYMLALAIALTSLALIGALRLLTDDPFGTLFAKPKYEKSGLEAAEKFRIRQAIDTAFQEKFHLRSDATLKKLSQSIGASSHQVSEVINSTEGVSFAELLALNRIREAKKMIRSGKYDHLKIESIASEVGYASKSAFNTSFKKFTGYTPAHYRDLPRREELLIGRQSRGITNERSTFEWFKNAQVMFINFIKIYFRNQLKNKSLSALNFVGLILGIASSILIYIYLNHELSYDRFHENYEDIYRIAWLSENPQTRTPHPLAQALVEDFEQVKSGVSISPIYGPGLTLQEIYLRNPETQEMFKEPDLFFADSTFFDVFDFKLLSGDPKEVLAGPGNIVISQKLAEKYFGKEDPVGKGLEAVEYGFTAQITGVMETPPVNSHFHPQVLLSYMSRKAANPEDPWMVWSDFGHFNYIKLQSGTDARSIEEEIIDWIGIHIELDEDALASMRNREAYFGLQPIKDIHLHSDIRWELEANGSYVYIFILFGALILLLSISTINYVNLTTARAIERAKEVGIRRSLGARKNGISVQFVSEAIVSCLLAAVLAYGLVYLMFGSLAPIIGDLPVTTLLQVNVVGFLASIVLIIGLLAGIYPAIFISQLKPVETLKGKFSHHGKGLVIRKALLMLQFVIATIMIFASAVVYQQIEFMQGMNLGFDEDQLMVVEMHTAEEIQRIEALKTEVKKLPGVVGCGGISNLPGSQFNNNQVFVSDRPEERVNFSEMGVDYDVLQIMGLTLNRGRWFNQSNALDSALGSFIVNEQAVAALNLGDTVFEESITWDSEIAQLEGRIVGVVEDFHYKSLHQGVQPLIIAAYPQASNYLLIKIEAGTNINALVSELETIHSTFDKDFDLDYYFLDRLIDQQYQGERRAFGIFKAFTFIAILLSALGLLGLAYLTIIQRTKEIGIRKVLGARASTLIYRENLAFIKMITVSVLIGVPIAYVSMSRWLEEFAYRSSGLFFPIIVTLLLVLTITFIFVSLAVMRTTMQNPTISMRQE